MEMCYDNALVMAVIMLRKMQMRGCIWKAI